MQYRTLGRTGLKVSLAGLGTGGASQLGQRTGRTPKESHAVVRAALDLGINLFDSSSAYRDSETLLGQALQGVSRDDYFLATKFQPYRDDALLKPEEMLKQLDQSLQALGTDHIDVYQYHAVTPERYKATVERFHGHLLRAQEEGKIRFIGITETVSDDPTHDMLPMALQDDLFDTLMIKYGILNQAGAEGTLPLALEKNVGVLVMAAVRTSLRTPQETVNTLQQLIDQGELDMPLPEVADPLGLGRVGKRLSSPTRAGYQFAAKHPAVSSVLIGTGNPDHLREDVDDLYAEPLSEAQFRYLAATFGELAWPK